MMQASSAPADPAPNTVHGFSFTKPPRSRGTLAAAKSAGANTDRLGSGKLWPNQ
jgi:hypothetical protein